MKQSPLSATTGRRTTAVMAQVGVLVEQRGVDGPRRGVDEPLGMQDVGDRGDRGRHDRGVVDHGSGSLWYRSALFVESRRKSADSSPWTRMTSRALRS